MTTHARLLVFIFLLLSSLCAAADYYDALGLEKTASQDEISRAYRRLALRYHPDRNEGNKEAAEKFKEVAAAFEVLSDPARRRLYDEGSRDEAFAGTTAAGVSKGPTGRRPESGFYDPTGIGRLNNSRINFLNNTYVEMRKTKSPAEALIATLRKERGMNRPRFLQWGVAFGDKIYESQTQHVFHEFMDEIMDDLFYTGEDIHAPTENPLLDLPKGQNALTVPRTNALTLSRLPSLEQVMEINRLFGGDGNYFFTQRAIKEARSKKDLTELFHYFMKNYWADDYLYYPDKRGQANVWDTRKNIVNALEPAVKRLYQQGASVPDFLGEFIQTRLSRISPTDRTMMRNLFAILVNIDTKEAYEAIRRMSSPDSNGLIRRLAGEALLRMDPKTLAFEHKPEKPENPESHQKGGALGATSSQETHLVVPTDEETSINEPSVKLLRDLLQSKADPHERMHAGLRLHKAGKLNEADLAGVVKAVQDYYGGSLKQMWHIIRPHSYSDGKTAENGNLRRDTIGMLLQLAPEHPSVIPALAVSLRAARQYDSAEEIIKYARKNNVQDPALVRAIADYAASHWHNQYGFGRYEAIEYLAEHASPDDKEAILILQKLARKKGSRNVIESNIGDTAVRALVRIAKRESAGLTVLSSRPTSPEEAAENVKVLKEILATPTESAIGHPKKNWVEVIKDIDRQFDAASRLYNLGKLDDADIRNLGVAVSKYYWRYRTYGHGGTEKIIHTLLELMPTHPEVIPMLARATEEGWGYPTDEIAVAAMEHGIRDPGLLEAFRVFVSSGIEERFQYRRVLEALGRLGNVKDAKLIATLRKKAAFHYFGTEPEPESYEAAIALGRLGAKDETTITLLRSLMHENEIRIYGSGVPFAAALAFLGFDDPEVTGLLKRELTYDPNGRREHTNVAKEGLMALEQRRGPSGDHFECNHPFDDIGRAIEPKLDGPGAP